jgi:hypothetical protein
MESLTAGTFVGAGSFRCRGCGYVLTLTGLDSLSECPDCGGTDFARASLFNTERIDHRERETTVGGALSESSPGDRSTQLAKAREHIERPGDYLCYEEGGELRTLSLAREWTRIGRSLAADIRFDDPTVSRRHALIVRQADGVRVLDDRSLNGVFVNGTRVEGKVLSDGDEIVVGRYRLTFVSVSARSDAPGAAPAFEVAGPDSLHASS